MKLLIHNKTDFICTSLHCLFYREEFILRTVVREDDVMPMLLSDPPDLFLSDVGKTRGGDDKDAFLFLEKVRVQFPSLKIVIFTLWESDELILGAKLIKASDYVIMNQPPEEIFEALRIALEGGELPANSVLRLKPSA